MPSMYTATSLAGKCRKGSYIGYADIEGYAFRRMIIHCRLLLSAIGMWSYRSFECISVFCTWKLTGEFIILAFGDYTVAFLAYVRTVKRGMAEPSFSSWSVDAISSMRRRSFYMNHFLFSSSLIPYWGRSTMSNWDGFFKAMRVLKTHMKENHFSPTSLF